MGDSFQQFISNMKDAVIFISLLVVCSSRVIRNRSLLGGGQSHGHGHHGHHEQHHRQQHPARQPFGQRAGRDGDHHQDDSENEIRAAPTGYLPAADDYEYEEEDLAGYNTDQAGTRSDDLDGYGAPEEEAAPRDVPGDYSAPPENQYESRAADAGYGAPAGAGAESEERGQDQYEGGQGGFPFAIVEGRH